MRLVAPLILGAALVGVGTVLLVFHKDFERWMAPPTLPRWWYFAVYQLGPTVLIVGGVVVIAVRLLGLAGIGPAA
jgi:hypothetical protein